MIENESESESLMDRKTLRKQLELAAESVSEGGGLFVLKLKFVSVGDDRMMVCGYTRCYDPERLTKRRALEELQRTRDFFDDVLEICPDFMERCGKTQVQYALALDYGTGAVGICFDTDGEISWRMELVDR